MNQYTDAEIKSALSNWRSIVARYQVPDTKKAVLQMLSSFGPFILLWIAMYFAFDYSITLTIVLGMINAFFLVRIFIIQHDCGHQSFLGSKKWNNTVGFFCSLFSSIPYKYWAKVHNHHHGHSGQLEMYDRDIGDIKYLTVREYNALSSWNQFKYRIFRSPVMLFIIAPVIYITFSNRYPVFNVKGWKNIKKSQLINNIVLFSLYALLGYLVGWKKFFIIQLMVVFLFNVIAFWFFYVQHQHEETYKSWRKNWDYLLSAIRGATYYKLPRVFQWLTGNIGFHHVHHLSSLIPNYNLEKCVRENPLFNKYATVITFKDSIKIARNKLWDQERDRMITFKEFNRLRSQGLIMNSVA